MSMKPLVLEMFCTQSFLESEERTSTEDQELQLRIELLGASDLRQDEGPETVFMSFAAEHMCGRGAHLMGSRLSSPSRQFHVLLHFYQRIGGNDCRPAL